MKVSGIVISTETKDDKLLMTCQMNGSSPKKDAHITVKWGRQRTNDQNSLYWVWLQWIFDNGAKNEGYASTEELHDAFKGRFLTENKVGHNGMKYCYIKSTTDLDTLEFTEYIDKCGQAAREFMSIDDARFWVDYHDFYSSIE